MIMNQIDGIDRKELRKFGIVGGAIISILLGCLLPTVRHHELSRWPWIVAMILWVWAIVAPATLNIVYRNWMRVGHILGWVQTRILLSLVFYLIVVPMGLIKQAFTKNSMVNGYDLELSTYRLQSRMRTKESMENPF
jgi:predicted membrane protein